MGFNVKKRGDIERANRQQILKRQSLTKKEGENSAVEGDF